MVFGPLFELEFQTSLHPSERNGRPDAGPQKRHSPADNICRISFEGEDKNRDDDGRQFGTNSPEECQSVQHLPEVVAGLISGVELLAELDIASTVDGNNVFNDPVDTRTQLGTGGHGRDAERRWEAEDAHTILDDHLGAEDVEEGCDGHGEETDGRVVGDGTAEV